MKDCFSNAKVLWSEREILRRETCPACGDHAAHKVLRLECNSCGCALVSDWERAHSSPIDVLLALYAAECSDFSGEEGYAFALKLARRYAERGPDSQMRCVVHTLLARLEAPNAAMQSALDDAEAKLAARDVEVERLRELVKRGLGVCEPRRDEDVEWMEDAHAALSEEVKGGE